MRSRNILETLTDEHQQLRVLFAQMEETTDATEKTRRGLLSKIEQHLMPHANWEEAVLF